MMEQQVIGVFQMEFGFYVLVHRGEYQEYLTPEEAFAQAKQNLSSDDTGRHKLGSMLLAHSMEADAKRKAAGGN